jgi:iron-sulfur cluster assembly accessory protein
MSENLNPVRLTEKAVKEINHVIEEQKKEPEAAAQLYVRMGVKGGGCSGFQYSFSLDEGYDESKDQLYEQDGLKIVVDKRSLMYLEGTTVDFHDSLEKRGFTFLNPSAVRTCGCGSSFSM